MQADIKKQFKTLNILYAAILVSISLAALFTVFFVFRSGHLPIFDAEHQALIKTVVIISLLVGIPVSHIFFYKKIKHINPDIQVVNKLRFYQTAFIVRVAMLEAIGLIALIGYLVTADKSFLYMFAVVFILFMIHAPTKNKLCSDLNLSEQEEELLF